MPELTQRGKRWNQELWLTRVTEHLKPMSQELPNICCTMKSSWISAKPGRKSKQYLNWAHSMRRWKVVAKHSRTRHPMIRCLTILTRTLIMGSKRRIITNMKIGIKTRRTSRLRDRTQRYLARSRLMKSQRQPAKGRLPTNLLFKIWGRLQPRLPIRIVQVTRSKAINNSIQLKNNQEISN